MIPITRKLRSEIAKLMYSDYKNNLTVREKDFMLDVMAASKMSGKQLAWAHDIVKKTSISIEKSP